MNQLSTIYIKPGKEKAIERRHPWIFSGAIKKIDGQPEDGDLVVVMSAKGDFLAVGHYNTGSISVKVLTWINESIDQKWYDQKLKSAQQMRAQLNLPSEHTTAFRLVHGEGDGLPGLIVDVYNDIAVIQPHSAGIKKDLPKITRSLSALGFKNIVHKPTGKVQPEVLSGEVPENIEVLEHGYKLRINIIQGQKTGFFIDQRENRKLLGDYSKGKTVFNVFSYTGGFSISAIAGGAEKAISVDSSAGALDQAIQNAIINDMADKHEILKVDAVPYLETMTEKFPIIVLDPPAFAKHKSARHNAIQAYRRINEAALTCLEPGGLLFTFSCSQVVDRQLFNDTVLSAAINVKREVQILHYLSQPADHPISLFHKEGDYLKGLVLRVL